MDEAVKKMWADPRFQLYSDLIKVLESSRIWGGMDWSYSPIHPVKYLPVKDQVRTAMDELMIEYGVKNG